MSDKITIYDIAKKLDITAATVSRALNNNPKISEKTRKLVLETAAKMNYKQNRLALALKSGKSNNVGVIVPRVDRSFFATVIKGIQDELRPFGYHVIICQTYDLEEGEIENIDALLNAQVDGIFMSVSNAMKDTTQLLRIVDKNVPLVFFDRKKELPGVSSVTINDFEGGYKATEHLIDMGCKKIAHIAGDRSIEIYRDRYEGYKKALVKNGFKLDENYIIEAQSTIEAGKEAANKLLKLKQVPDAIFSSSDFVALGIIRELKSRGYSIPNDIAIVGFSNEPFTEFMELTISSVDQSPLEMGKIAAQVFLEQVNNPNKLKIEKKVVLPSQLHVRMSSVKNETSQKKKATKKPLASRE
ncbi:MAG: LacI family DNA-binding transcriptional regulator [Flavobacteriaceae bacterium]|nr:LacI family DNA-binding transcriptional regulator [Flavobacteriaceae bacterium]